MRRWRCLFLSRCSASGVADRPIRWIVDDCAKFVEREIRRGRRYDAIIMDPPSYGRGPGGEVWKLETNLWPFVELVSGVLSDDPLFVIINSYTTGLSPSVLTYLSESIFTRRFGGRSESQELETLAARKILSGDVHAGDTLVLDVQNGEFIVTVKDGN